MALGMSGDMRRNACSHSGAALFRDVRVRVRESVCEWIRRLKEKNGMERPSMYERC